MKMEGIKRGKGREIWKWMEKRKRGRKEELEEKGRKREGKEGKGRKRGFEEKEKRKEK